MSERRAQLVRTLLVWILLEVVAAAQVESGRGGVLLWSWVRAVGSPLVVSAEVLGEAASDLAWGLGDVIRLVSENRRLRRELATARARALLLEEDLATERAAGDLRPLADAMGASVVVTRCRYRDLANGRMELDAGLVDGIRRGAPAVAAKGLVGRVVRVESRRCWLELITHPAAAVAVRTEDGAVDALIVGRGKPLMGVEYVPRRAPVVRGSLLVSSGADGVYPPGIPVATIASVREAEGPFLRAKATPTATLNAVRVVLVVTGSGADARQGRGR